MNMRDSMRVTVTSGTPVDGGVRRRGGPHRTLATDTHSVTVSPTLMNIAKGRLRAGERLVIVSETEVHLVPR